MGPLTKRQLNTIDKQINEIVCRRCSGLQINIMDISKVFQAGRDAASGVTGQDVEAAVYETYSRLAREAAESVRR